MNDNPLYLVVTLYDCMEDTATLAWLAHGNIPLPRNPPPGRYPSPAEIKAIIETIPGLRTYYLTSSHVWQATLMHRKDVLWATLAIKNYCGDPDQPHQFYYTAGWDEMIHLVTAQLAKRCGPFVLLPDSGADPEVIG